MFTSIFFLILANVATAGKLKELIFYCEVSRINPHRIMHLWLTELWETVKNSLAHRLHLEI